MPAGAAPALAASANALGLAAGAAGAAFDVEPLFATGGHGVGLAAGGHQWYIARPRASLAGANPWDVVHDAHARLAAGPAIAAGAAPDFIEPDLAQPWPQELPAPALAAAADVCVFEDQVAALPGRPGEFAWHLADAFAQLRTARSQIDAAAALVRIAHLDTGYDREHVTFPAERVELALQQNFVDGEDAADAHDPGTKGLMRSPGHGTGTLSILAGRHFQFAQDDYQPFDDDLGGALQARIVPVRVADSVVQLTTSAVARGISYVADLCADEATRVHVITMSMGGVASAAWADAVNKAYEAGIVYVAAAGNNFSAGFFGFPTHQIVYPARFRRVIAACGVMANRLPYYGLAAGTLQGNWGPQGSMATALSAFTPNIPWAVWGCSQIVRMSGSGTSAATPQIAATAALYLQRHAAELFDTDRYPEPWMRVEAVRRALFLSADKNADGGSTAKLGNGIVRAAAALALAPAEPQSLQKTKPDQAGFPFLNVLSSRALAPSATDQMLQLEATQLIHRWQQPDVPNPLESVIDDPDRDAADIAPAQMREFLEIVSEHPQASERLKQRARQVLDGMAPPTTSPAPTVPTTPTPAPPTPAPTPPAGATDGFKPGVPPYRALRGYAVDPSLTTNLDTAEIGVVTFQVPWESLDPGPVGEYLEVIDIDPASQACYEPVNLNDPMILAQNGLPPSEGVPQFHQQMAYAISSLTIQHFERALGRRTLWRPRRPGPGENPKDDSHFVQRLRVYPHALREANAYYSPDKIALLFGYFTAVGTTEGDQLPGARVFTCLSHDIVAHETTHALLDGMHRRFLLPSNRDVQAFHEGFADCVAMLQHFTFPELVQQQIANTRGEIASQESLLVQLASQFGVATGKRTALRDAIGQLNEQTGKWELRPADPREYETTLEPHDRGRILVAAVFDAFLSIYKRRTADLLRLASGGTGILRPGAIHPDLVRRLAGEAAKSAQHVLTMCIRALDYCPPTDITFGEYLRAIITADYDLVKDDDLHYRVSFVEAFRRRGIFPPGVSSLSVGSLLWHSPEQDNPPPSDTLLSSIEQLRDPGSQHLYASTREELFHLQRDMRRNLHGWLVRHLTSDPEGERDARFLGLDRSQGFEVHMARFAYRVHPDDGISPQLLVGLLQSTTVPGAGAVPTMSFEGGCTIVADLRRRRISYCIRKSLHSSSRLQRQQQFALREFDSLHATYLGARSLREGGEPREPFALIHRGS
jgi:hypothetical protein